MEPRGLQSHPPPPFSEYSDLTVKAHTSHSPIGYMGCGCLANSCSSEKNQQPEQSAAGTEHAHSASTAPVAAAHVRLYMPRCGGAWSCSGCHALLEAAAGGAFSLDMAVGDGSGAATGEARRPAEAASAAMGRRPASEPAPPSRLRTFCVGNLCSAPDSRCLRAALPSAALKPLCCASAARGCFCPRRRDRPDTAVSTSPSRRPRFPAALRRRLTPVWPCRLRFCPARAAAGGT